MSEPVTKTVHDLKAESLSLKLADTETEIIAAQNLRYQIFYQEMGAHPVGDMARFERDYDEYDKICDHLLVIDHTLPARQNIVGTYRMLMQEKAQVHNMPMYCESGFDFERLKSQNGRIMEVSRSCVLPSHRSRLAVNLLWKGIAAQAFANNVDYLVGTPSLPGTDLSGDWELLAYLGTYHLAPQEIRPVARPDHRIEFPHLDKSHIDARRMFIKLPPLLKGYLRISGVIGDGAYIDHQFNVIDLSIVVAIKNVTDKYFNHYSRNENHAEKQ